MSFQTFVISVFLSLLLYPFSTISQEVSGSNDSLLPNWQSNLRWSIDLATQSISSHQDSYMKNIVGLDIHKVFSNSDRDIGTLTFQPYIVNFSGSDSVPPFFDGHDTELTWRIANFNYMVLPNGVFNIRAGHFEIPFGLEQNIDTNGTLRQYSFRERGIKADWGVSVNGVLPQWDYEISLSRGSGNDINDSGDPYIFSGRIGSPAHKNFVVGISFFDGETYTPADNIRRHRLGIDVAWYRNNWELLAELSAGEDNDADTSFALLEASWRNPNESLHFYTQFKQRHLELAGKTDSGAALIFGGRMSLSRNLSISGQWSKPVDHLGIQTSSSEYTLQLRYRL